MKKIYALLLCVCSFLSVQVFADNRDTNSIEFFIVIPSYNNEKWCIKNLESIVNQTYPHVSIVYINDCSTDKTGALVDAYIEKHQLQHRVRVIHNPKRVGAMANIYKGGMMAPEHKVVAFVDGDDWLLHNRVLEMIAKVYKDNPNIWVTHGNYTTDPFVFTSYCRPYPVHVQKSNTFRRHKWMGCQLRTFYGKLFHQIQKEDLMYKGEFFKVSSDIAYFSCILELAGYDRIGFIKEPIYVVNMKNPISDIRHSNQKQVSMHAYIDKLPPYKRMETLFDR